MSERPESVYEEEVNRFLRFTEGATACPDDLNECLWRMGNSTEDDALLHEYRRIGMDAPAWMRLEAERRSRVSPHERLRESWVELLTKLHFPGDAAPATEFSETGVQLLEGLIAALERAGEPLESARTRAVMALHDLVLHPERYPALRAQAGLTSATDTDEETRSDALPAGLTPLPWCKPDTEAPSSDVPPLVPRELFLEPGDESAVFPARAAQPPARVESPPVAPSRPSPGPTPHEDPHEHDTWVSKNLRFKSDR
ncbi:MAG: hypothetical protein RBU21_08540 [FCB group bacterium]|jgi:hypothetical protein|nr:hypothetical protein [FCB group bacterium]